MEDHHVDRPGVEAQQCAKLTGTNRSFGLIHPSAACSDQIPRQAARPRLDNKQHFIAAHRSEIRKLCPPFSALRFRSDDLVVMARGITPDPIPNSAVKTLSANGTAS